jgi:hypothetical protein
LLALKFDTELLEQAFREILTVADVTLDEALTKSAILVSNEAKSSHKYIDRTGALTKSITPTSATGSHAAGTAESTVYAGARYAAAIEYGTKAHRITGGSGGNLIAGIRGAEARRMLRYEKGGRIFYRRSVWHPGTKPYKYLAEGLQRRLPDCEQLCAQGMALAFERVGFSIER